MDWSDYEKEVHKECHRAFYGANIEFNIHICGIHSRRKRQIDILIKDIEGRLYIVDAKNYNKKIDIKTVESFIGMVKDVNAEYGIIVSEKGFTKSAINRAHYGEDKIEVDILSLNELKQFQATCAIPYMGHNGTVVNAPFCWIIDGTNRPNMVATMYPRGLSLEEAAQRKEWAYLNFWTKDGSIDSTDKLIHFQNQLLINENKDGIISVSCDEGIVIRSYISQKYPTEEITLFKEFNEFILFIVLFTPDNVKHRNIKKIKQLLRNAVPITINQT